MDINVLREYIVLSQTLNYTKAASALFIQQSTLSKHIASLEKELDVTLLERDHRQVQLTNVGNIFTAAAIEIVNTYDEVLRKIEEVQRYEPLKVGGVVSDPVVSSIMSIANTFLDEEGYPPPEISPNESEGQESLEQLRQGRIDIAVSFAELELLEKWGLTTYLSQDPNSSHWSILKTPFPRRAESRLTTCEISVSSNMQIAMPRTVGRT